MVWGGGFSLYGVIDFYNTEQFAIGVQPELGIQFNNGVKNVRAKECPKGYVTGRLSLPKNHGKHISEANKGIKYWNNGIVTIKSFTQPEGFVHGALPHKK